MKKKLVLLAAGLCLLVSVNAQTLYVPEANGSTPGLGTSTINGNVGIGLSNPQEKLDLYGKVSSRFYSDFPAIKAIFGHFGNTGGLSIISQGANNTTLGSGDIRFLTSVSNSGSSSTESPTDLRMIIKYNGNVGIGTINPPTKLSVREINNLSYFTNNKICDIIKISTSVSDNFVPNNLETRMLFTAQQWYDGADFSLGAIGAAKENDNNYGRLTFYTSRGSADGSCALIERMRLSNDGNLLIGKTTQNGNYKLDVDGSIRANEIKVNTTGADFVFEPTYKLRPLSEVETFIKANKHLPDVAPAAEMQKNGVNVNELQTTLLQKVEELTLYVIELKKENEEMKKELKTLKNK